MAVDLAIRSLWDRSTYLALAGGVTLLLTPVNSFCFAHSGMMAADGHCKIFDASADVFVCGEGCGPGKSSLAVQRRSWGLPVCSKTCLRTFRFIGVKVRFEEVNGLI